MYPPVVLERFNSAPSKPGQLPVKILPYRTGIINAMTVGTVECISGEFTGCIMTLYREGQALKAGHVDTVVHYLVDKETHNYSAIVSVPGERGKTAFGLKSETRYKVLHPHGIRNFASR